MNYKLIFLPEAYIIFQCQTLMEMREFIQHHQNLGASFSSGKFCILDVMVDKEVLLSDLGL